MSRWVVTQRDIGQRLAGRRPPPRFCRQVYRVMRQNLPPPNQSTGTGSVYGSARARDAPIAKNATSSGAGLFGVSAWGLIVVTLLLLTGYKIKFGGRQPKRV